MSEDLNISGGWCGLSATATGEIYIGRLENTRFFRIGGTEKSTSEKRIQRTQYKLKRDGDNRQLNLIKNLKCNAVGRVETSCRENMKKLGMIGQYLDGKKSEITDWLYDTNNGKEKTIVSSVESCMFSFEYVNRVY